MLHDWLLQRGRQNVAALPVCAYGGTHSNGTINRGTESKGALKGRKKRRRNHIYIYTLKSAGGHLEYQLSGWILHIDAVCFLISGVCNWIFLLPRSPYSSLILLVWRALFSMVMDVATTSASLCYVATIAFWASAFQRTSKCFNLHLDSLCILLVCLGKRICVHVDKIMVCNTPSAG